MGNESVPIQLAQCRFPGLAISNAEILMYFSNKIYGSDFIKQLSGTAIIIIIRLLRIKAAQNTLLNIKHMV